jgi:hypothetical protein
MKPFSQVFSRSQFGPSWRALRTSIAASPPRHSIRSISHTPALPPSHPLASPPCSSISRNFSSDSSSRQSSSSSSSSSTPDYEAILAQIRTPHPHNNVSSVISDKVGRNLHLQKHHPLRTIKVLVEQFCLQHATSKGRPAFQLFDQESPVVSTQSCFDDLLVPPDHVSRSLSDTYYINDTTVSE